MVDINLLPWRLHQQHDQAQAIRKNILMTLAFTLLLLIFIHVFLHKKEITLSMEVTRLKQNVNHHHATQSKANIPTFTAMHELNQYGVYTKKWFAELGRQKNTTVCFNAIQRQQHTITFLGQTSSLFNLADFLLHWPAANSFSEIHLQHVQQTTHATMQFELRALENNAFRIDKKWAVPLDAI